MMSEDSKICTDPAAVMTITEGQCEAIQLHRSGVI